jgi:hypothetical protein
MGREYQARIVDDGGVKVENEEGGLRNRGRTANPLICFKSRKQSIRREIL